MIQHNLRLRTIVLIVLLVLSSAFARSIQAEPYPGTQPLTWEGDLAVRLVETVDQFLLRELERSVARRPAYWQRDFSSIDAYQQSIEPQRQRLGHMLGVRDPRVPFDAPELICTTRQPALVGRGENFDVLAIRWPAFGNVYGEGLLLVPRDRPALANIVAIPDCELLPEQLVGLVPGVPVECQYARRLAESGCRVVVPLLINRQRKQFDWGPRPAPDVTNREMLYRSAYELGRGLIGYEIQKILSLVDWWSRPGAGRGDTDVEFSLPYRPDRLG